MNMFTNIAQTHYLHFLVTYSNYFYHIYSAAQGWRWLYR